MPSRRWHHISYSGVSPGGCSSLVARGRAARELRLQQSQSRIRLTTLRDPSTIDPRYLDRSLVDYSEDLPGTLPGGLPNVMYPCTGSDANDLPLRIAATVTGKRGVIVTRNAHHGVTPETAAVLPSLGGDDSIAPSVRLVDAPAGDGAEFADAAALAAADLCASQHGFAALIADSIFASDRVQRVSALFLRRIGDIVHDADGLDIADEVQAGFGRPGLGLWGFRRHDAALGAVVPDIVTIG
jgi:4-aminobutyrate aminotransferase-like enzyme